MTSNLVMGKYWLLYLSNSKTIWDFKLLMWESMRKHTVSTRVNKYSKIYQKFSIGVLARTYYGES